MIVILANIAAPLIITKTGGFVLALSIIPLEGLVLWLLFRKLQIHVSFIRLLLVSLVANNFTSLVGVLVFLSNIFTSTMNLALLLGFILSFPLEWLIYRLLLKRGEVRKHFMLLKAAFLSNLASYTFLYVAVLLLALPPHPTWFLTLNPKRAYREAQLVNIPTLLRSQINYYLVNYRFASSITELQSPEDTIRQEERFYHYTIQADKEKAIVNAIPKSATFISFTGVVGVVKQDESEPQFITEICRSNQPSLQPPSIPSLSNNQVQCPPGSSPLRNKRSFEDRHP